MTVDAYEGIRRDVLARIERRQLRPEGDLDEVRIEVHRAVDEYERLARLGEELPLVSPSVMVDRVLRSITDFGPMTDLIARRDVEEIFLEGGRVSYLDASGHLRGLTVPTSEEESRQMIERLLAPTDRQLNTKHPMVQARVLDGTARLTAAIPPIGDRLSATLRRYVVRNVTLDDLVSRDSLSREAAAFLVALMQLRSRVAVSGEPGAGKTTLAAALLAAAPPSHCVRSCEEIRELAVPITHGSYYEVRPPALDGTGEISMRDLVKFVLAMRPDRIVVGEVRGAEAFELSRAVNAGCGFLCTVHANSASEALDALVNAALMAGENVTERIVRKVFSESLDVVIHVDRDDLVSGDADSLRRQVMEIAAVVPALRDDFTVEPLFMRDEVGSPLRWTGALPSRLEERLAGAPERSAARNRVRRGASAVNLAAALCIGVFCYCAAGHLLGCPPRVHIWRRRASAVGSQQLWISQAGLALTPLQFWAGSVAVGAVALAAGTLVTGAALVAVVPAIAVALLPRSYFGRRRATRLRAVQAAWPDGLRDLVSSIAAGRSLSGALIELAASGPAPLRAAFVRFESHSRMLGTVPALEVIREELADPTSDRVIEVLILASERGGQIVKEILEDLVAATTKDLKVLDEIETEGLEMRINARAVLVLPWFVLVALTLRGRVPGVLRIARGAARRARRRSPQRRWLRVDQSSRPVAARTTSARRWARRDGGGSMTNGPLLAVAVGGAGLAAAGTAALVVRPMPRLGPRVRPYTIVARARARRDADATALAQQSARARGGTLRRLFAPPLRAVTARVGAIVERRDDEQLSLSLRQAGFVDVSPSDYRTRVVSRLLLFSGGGAALGIVVIHSALATLGLASCGAVVGISRARGRIDRAIQDRTERIRLELYTVNQLLAMNVRTGAGPIQAVQRLTDRGSGAVVEELGAVLTAVRRGTAEPAAFRRAADLTPEPAAARTYKLFAAGAERGVDLAAGLRALSEDIRDSRREEIRQSATRRRAAMLVPTIAVLAPVMLLFIAAPLPSIVFGSR